MSRWHTGSKAPLKSGPSGLLDEGRSAIFLREPTRTRHIPNRMARPAYTNRESRPMRPITFQRYMPLILPSWIWLAPRLVYATA